MSRHKNILKKEKRRAFNDYRRKQNLYTKLREEKQQKVNMVQQNYKDALKKRADYTKIRKNMRDIGLPKVPTSTATYKELETVEDITTRIGDVVTNYINDEINNNKNRMLNKIGEFFTTELSHIKLDKLKEIAKQDMNKFETIENGISKYLEDDEVYEFLFYDDTRVYKDIKDGMENIVEHLLIDMGVNVSELEKEQTKKWVFN